MRLPYRPLTVLFFLASLGVSAAPSVLDVNSIAIIPKDDEHGHSHHHGSPLASFDAEKEPTPAPSYWSIDLEGDAVGQFDNMSTPHPGLMLAHAISMSAAFFVFLPVGICFRSVKHAWHGAAVLGFWGSAAVGISTSSLYHKLTPNMYEHAVHASHSYILLFLVAILTFCDIFAGLKRTTQYLLSVRAGNQSLSLPSLWKAITVQELDFITGNDHEYAHLVSEPEEMTQAEFKMVRSQDLKEEEGQWANSMPFDHDVTPPSSSSEDTCFGDRLKRSHSQHSDDTLHEIPRQPLRRSSSTTVKHHSRWARLGKGVFHTTEYTLVLAGFAELLEGIVVYTGGCRSYMVNACLAHLIKGSIFWVYGLLTFARFLGAYANLGWAWNVVPKSGSQSSSEWRAPSAEFVESAVIFTYGITNTWMERFNAKPGDPLSTRQIQHIGIAVMFWFAGLLGMVIESRRVRRWLAASAVAGVCTKGKHIEEPASYRASFNPFPSMVIGITGAAMAAHEQAYVFQVQIHQLWGNLLVAYAIFRWLTYMFLWISPPRSFLPSRPPTEALASFFLACGGLAFMLSTEDVTLAAMRKGRDDIMMVATVVVAFTCFAFCWTTALVGLKGYLKSRTVAIPAFRAAV